MKYESYNINEGVSKHRSLIGWLIAGSIAIVTAIILWTAISVSAAPAATTAYDATPSTLPPNVVSLGYQATSTSEFGDRVTLAGTDRVLKDVTVTMSNWALYSEYATNPLYMGNAATWTHPITLNIYSTDLVGGVPTTKLATVTQDVVIPWRPVASEGCGTAWRASDDQCYNGIAFNATFDMSSLNVTLPNEVIVAVAYNTQSYGEAPLSVAGPYNSLNVGIPDNQTAVVGTDSNVDSTFWNTTYPGYTAGLREDTGWTPNGTVALKITTTAPTKPMDVCKNGGYLALNYKNQGQCIAGVQSSEKSKHNR